MSDNTNSTATTRDGTRLSYRLVKGSGQGRIALVHSLAMDKTFWEPTVAALEGFADALLFDCRGHGASDKPSGPYSVELFANDVADLLDYVGWKSAVLAGASMGGCVALAFAAIYPERVEALGLFDTTAWYGEDAPKAWTERADKALAGGMAALVGFQKTRWFSDSFRGANPDVVEKAVGVFLENDLSAYAATCAMLGNADIRAALPHFDFPCRVAVGTEDYATPPDMARYMAENIPGAGFFIMEGVRHFAPLEVPSTIAAHLKELIKAGSRL
ncbi:alpha/beta fold hydrolase (plasmid) [Sinorhizobium meliloti]|uniref:alpha/beta fold hydrolase n=1 Tax=Rhizobium meliloti TaxID=382 RepID=UPI002D76AAA8|nr:alpha/beta fold hydrolase [Sinorhizobium meliloti]WRQ70148.1 alpha/beta fold hydrolase [Sinorhizobium meliloti]